MMDLHDRLARIAGPAVAPSAAEADADLARGRRALRRRRSARALGASAFAVVALAVAVTIGTQAGPTTTTADNAPAQAVATRLVAYEGEQPQGFTIDKVPAGWEIQGGDAATLTIAPENGANKSPNVYVDKILITLRSGSDHSTPTGTQVEVGGKPGVLNNGDGTTDGLKNLLVKQPDGVWLLVQIWDARGWTQQDIIEFADGIHVQPGVVHTFD
ncbi:MULTISPECIES: hypothetical protein [unclassified Micromonospora]|uniref:hypothetical protein n=1 Tax=unclassified Micromonospora TaxID=2617518 RepID=UPI0022B65E7B|nr:MULTISPECIES: hypothetical protein [unclassified Micromonospora]MCZ7421350.1 hypothetical protein [Verrucosispora sp. WMMA2121]WBB93956.1 hypothetical protein O7597_13780 [Verrucosispora sp. WMMC514]